MHDYVIVPREMIRAKGAAAFLAGRDHNSHGFNPGSAAIQEFHNGYNAAAEQASPESPIAPHRRARVDLRQTEAV